MDAFTKGDYAYKTDGGSAAVHVPQSISASLLAHAATKLAAAKQANSGTKAA